MTQKTAVVTGAGSGMGRSISLQLAGEGFHIVLVGKTESKLRNVANEISNLNGSSTVKTFDITEADKVKAMANELADTAVDVLVNCAGDWLIKTIDETTDDDLDHILGVNLKAPYLLSRDLLPHLRKSDNASIINIGSMAAVNSFSGISAYTAAKTGLRGLTGSIADELRPELIRVVMLSPTPANTPMRWDASPDIDPKMLVEPETIAQIVSVIVNLPKGITLSDITLGSMLLEMGD